MLEYKNKSEVLEIDFLYRNYLIYYNLNHRSPSNVFKTRLVNLKKQLIIHFKNKIFFL